MINKTSDLTLEAIRRKSAQPLPNNPTEAGYKASEIRNAFYKPILDKENSVLSELDRIVDEINNSDYIPNSYVNILDFGADPTGVADSTDALESARILAGTSGKGVYIPDGKFRVTRCCAITTNLLGNGDKSILYLEVDSTGFNSNNALRINTGSPVKIEKIHFQTNGKVLNGSNDNYVIGSKSTDGNTEIRDCYFTGLSGNIRAIDLVHGTHVISNNCIKDAEIAVAASNITSNLVIDHNTIVSSTIIGIYITNCPNPSLMIIKDNVITGDSSNPSIWVKTTSGAVIMNNTVKMLSTVAPYQEDKNCNNTIIYNSLTSEAPPIISPKSLYKSADQVGLYFHNIVYQMSISDEADADFGSHKLCVRCITPRRTPYTIDQRSLAQDEAIVIDKGEYYREGTLLNQFCGNIKFSVCTTGSIGFHIEAINDTLTLARDDASTASITGYDTVIPVGGN